MSKLDEVLKYAKVTHLDAAFPGQHFHGVNTPAVKEQFKEIVKELMANSIEELVAKNSTSASDYINILQKKVEAL